MIRSAVAFRIPAVSALLACLAAVLSSLASAAPALAGECPRGSVYSNCAPGWEVSASAFPSTLAPNGTGVIAIDVMNVGAANSSGPVTVTDVLPEGVEAIAAGNVETLDSEPENDLWECSGTRVVTCTNNKANMPSLAGGGGNPTVIEGGGTNYDPVIGIDVRTDAHSIDEIEAREHPNRVTIAGGGAPAAASSSNPVPVSTTPVGTFGIVGWNGWASNADGTSDTQAGSHPYEFTTSLDLASAYNPARQQVTSAGGEVRNLEVKLPPGFAGNPNAVPQCTMQQFNRLACPLASQLGIQEITFANGGHFRERIWNLVPPPGVAAEFATTDAGIKTFYESTVRSGGDYGLTVHINNVPERQLTSVVTTFWGVPGDPTHDAWRNETSSGCSSEALASGECSGGANPGVGPLLTMPTECGKLLPWTVRANTWLHPEDRAQATFDMHDSNQEPFGLEGCQHLQFGPSITTTPDTVQADTPAGLTVEVRPPVGGLEDATGLSAADIRDTTVTLPEGTVINPGQAVGLQACQQGDIPGGDDLPLPGEDGEEERFAGPPDCPAASKVGTVMIRTPLLEGAAEKQLEGDVYVLQSEPPELKLLVAASGDGVNLKLIGIVHLNEQTGRLVTTFADTPGLPFTIFRLAFSGGPQAALATPTHCGTYTTTSDFTPWSTPFDGDAFPTAAFALTEGAGHQPCPAGGALPYQPEMIAGSTTDQAGGFTDFSLLLRVPDDNQRTSRLQFKTPEGLLGMISKVPLCTNAQAESNSCPEASRIGHTVVQSGPGPYPLVVPEPGQPPAPIYLTEGYGGGNYGLSIVVPLHVGPFVLPTQRVRAKIEVDPLTSQLTITTDPLPQVIAGVPTDLRTIDAVIDRPGFMFNPTGCEPQAFSGTAFGEEGAAAPISSHFQMGSCRALLFQPNFKVSTSAKTSRADGASLGVKIVYPGGDLGANQASGQSNIRMVKVELPKQLPSRLTTLQKACTAAQFDANPAGCPAASVVGSVRVLTPVLPVPLTGPAYFVSNGGEGWPNLVMVIQGYGVTIHLVGDTFISKAGITSSTFNAVPDVPIESFELNLPEGPYSALTGLGNLCKHKLVMPTEFVGQNGAEIHQRTPVAVQGCKKAKKAKKGKHRSKHPRARRAGHKRAG